MTPERWRQVDGVFQAVRALPASERDSFLERACAGDTALKDELERLLAADARGFDFLNPLAVNAAARALAVDRVRFTAGSRIGPYEVESLLGAGGMGAVYKARDTRLGRTVAIKVINAEFTQRFEREARAIAALNHPHICTLYEVGEHEGAPYLVMEYVEGQPLKGPLPASEALQYAIQVCKALAAAHSAGIVHRDLKPDNILLTGEGSVKVLDFGLAKLQPTKADPATLTTMTEKGSIVGTGPYMSPEQAMGEAVDARSDIFSFGAVLYELLSGRRAFRRETMTATLAAVMSQEPPPLKEAPSDVARIVGKMLAKKREDRYQSVEELLADMEAALTGASRAARRRWLSGIAAVMIAILAVAGLDIRGWRTRLVEWVRAPAPSVRLAVLPFENMTGDPGQEYVSDGLTDAMIVQLGRLHPQSLLVIGRRTAMRYKGTSKPTDQIGRELGVDYILEASMRREAGRVRISAYLTRVKNQAQLWAASYDRESAGELALESEVAQRVANSLAIKLLPDQQARLSKVRQVSPEAHDAYLRAVFYLNQDTKEGNQKGMAALNEALELDPADAMANAQMGLGYILLAHGADPPDDALARGKAAVRTALELDSNLPEAFAVSGMIKGYDNYDWEGAIQDIQHGLRINPSLAFARFHLAWFYVLMGRMDEAVAEHKRVQELDPLVPGYAAQFAWLYELAGRPEEAVREAQRVVEMNPKGGVIGHYVLGLVQEDRGRYNEAIADIQRAAAVNPAWKWALGPAYAVSGRTAEARALIAELNQQKVNRWQAFWLAQTHSALGNKDEAFRWLNFDRPHIWAPWLLTRIFGRYMVPVRNDPRFRELQVRMHVPH